MHSDTRAYTHVDANVDTQVLAHTLETAAACASGHGKPPGPLS